MIYLLHFDRPLGDLANPRGMASHYLGWTPDDIAHDRIEAHRAGRGARITAAAVAQGITLSIALLLEGDRSTEKRLKARKNGRLMCPICKETNISQTP